MDSLAKMLPALRVAGVHQPERCGQGPAGLTTLVMRLVLNQTDPAASATTVWGTLYHGRRRWQSP